MAAAGFTFKIHYNGRARRVTLPTAEVPAFSDLERKVRDLFNIPASQKIAIAYKDEDGEFMDMDSTEELKDACFSQKLNPLHLAVSHTASGPVVIPAAAPSVSPAPATPAASLAASSSSSSPGSAAQAKASDGQVPPPTGKTDVEEYRHLLELLVGPTGIVSGETAADILERSLRGWEYSLRALSPAAEGVKQLVPECEAAVKKAGRELTPVVIRTLERVVKSLKANQVLVSPSSENARNSEKNVSSSDKQSEKEPSVPPTAAYSQSGEPRPDVDVDLHTVRGSLFSRLQYPNVGYGGYEPLQKDKPSSVEHPSQVLHHGVKCDGCGIAPIPGSRFISLKRFDYDLCLSCYKETVDDGEYERIDVPRLRKGRPVCHPPPSASYGRPYYPGPAESSMARPYRYPTFQGSFSRPFQHAMPSFRGPQFGVRASCRSVSSGVAKPDARFVQDVSIFDGTEFAPGTHFTKIWRLRNSGSVPWPHNTQLVHVGGDALGGTSVTPLQMPEGGLVPEAELDAPIDLVAPERPGRYISHWRLQAPNGPKFGHRVWVLIQVVPKGEQSPQLAASIDMESSSSASKDAESISSPDQTEVSLSKEDDGKVEDEKDLAGIKEPPVTGLVSLEKEQSGFVDIVPANVPSPVTALPDEVAPGEVPLAENTEVEGFSVVEMPVGNSASSIPASSQSVSTENFEGEVSELDKELGELDSLLLKLESMGFREKSLNKYLLESNGFDLQRTVDDLVSAADWDPIMEELEEMGFSNLEENRRLMFKNNGSVKRVVKELVQMYADVKPKVQFV